jgi:hypothetical protein
MGEYFLRTFSMLYRSSRQIFNPLYTFNFNKSSLFLHFRAVRLYHKITFKTQTIMKLTNVIATGAILVAIAFATVVTKAQSSDVKQDRKDVRKDEDKKAEDIAKRNRAEKNGNPKQAVIDEKRIQKDNKNLHKDKKEVRKDEGKK